MRVVAIAVAGSAGALARYGVGRAFGVRTFPWATLAVNLVGSFLLGLLLGTATSRNWSELTTLTLGTGFLGAFTTFSTFSYESYTLLRTDRVGLAATYLAVSMVGGLVTAAIGWSLGRHVL